MTRLLMPWTSQGRGSRHPLNTAVTLGSVEQLAGDLQPYQPTLMADMVLQSTAPSQAASCQLARLSHRNEYSYCVRRIGPHQFDDRRQLLEYWSV